MSSFSQVTKFKRFFVASVFLVSFYAFVSHGVYKAERHISRMLKSSTPYHGVHDHTTRANSEEYIMKGLVTGNSNGSVFCSHKSTTGDSALLRLNNFFRNETEWKEDGASNIFLIESSCDSKPNYRSWCSVESMAQQNPKGIVWYVMTSPVVDLSDGLVKQLLQKYKNLRLVTVDLDDVFEGTPLEELYRSGAWHSNATKWPAVNLGDILRMAMVWHAGGFYSDSDIICISPLTELRNVLGMSTFNLVNNANFHFDRHHPMLEKFMLYVNGHFNPSVWGMNGPEAFSAVLRSVCKHSILHSGLQCDGAKILSPTAFNPIPPHLMAMLFQKTTIKDMHLRFPGSYAIHVWNRNSRFLPAVKDGGTIYDEASKRFCPLSRELATKKSKIY